MDTADNHYGAALARGIKILGRRAMSEAALVDKLSDEGYPELQISEAADELRRLGFLNDQRYAESVIHYYMGRGCGRRRILNELISRGIDKQTAEDLCEQLSFDGDDIYALLVSRIKSPRPTRKDIDRAAQFLFRRGFGSEQISEAVRRFKSEVISERSDCEYDDEY